jgi:hypothetical protein
MIELLVEQAKNVGRNPKSADGLRNLLVYACKCITVVLIATAS